MTSWRTTCSGRKESRGPRRPPPGSAETCWSASKPRATGRSSRALLVPAGLVLAPPVAHALVDLRLVAFLARAVEDGALQGRGQVRLSRRVVVLEVPGRRVALAVPQLLHQVRGRVAQRQRWRRVGMLLQRGE